MKDNFSTASSAYARFRPTYPQEVFYFLKKILENKEKAWDCGTGNGQVAGELANFFQKVQATDISKEQLKNALQNPNIHYTVQAAEKTAFADESFDLITVAQAIHWFNFSEFYREAQRVLKPKGIIAIIGYSLFKSNPQTDEVILKFYKDIIGPFWDEERRYLEDKYQSIPFPFQEIETPEFEKEYEWTFDHLIGYLNTWSAVKHYEKLNKRNPVDLIKKELEEAFGSQNKVIFPILLRIGNKI